MLVVFYFVLVGCHHGNVVEFLEAGFFRLPAIHVLYFAACNPFFIKACCLVELGFKLILILVVFIDNLGSKLVEKVFKLLLHLLEIPPIFQVLRIPAIARSFRPVARIILFQPLLKSRFVFLKLLLQVSNGLLKLFVFG